MTRGPWRNNLAVNARRVNHTMQAPVPHPSEAGATRAGVVSSLSAGGISCVQRLALLITIVAAALLAIVLALGLRQARFQIRRLLDERIEARLKERTRIAGELHDSLLQGFQALMFRLQAVRQLLPERASEAAAQLERALETGDRAIEEGRDAARDLRELDVIPGDLSDVLAAFRDQFECAAGSDPPGYRVLVEGEPRPLDAPVRDEVSRVVREAVLSAFRHAGARLIEADLLIHRHTFASE